MKKIKEFCILTGCLLSVTSCSNLTNTSNVSNNDKNNENTKSINKSHEYKHSDFLDKVDYEFDTFEKFQEFYSVFKEYNTQRYIFPTSSEDVPITYLCQFEVVKADESEPNRYDTKVESAEMGFKFSVNNKDLEFSIWDVTGTTLDIEEECVFKYNIHYTNKKCGIQFYTGDQIYASLVKQCEIEESELIELVNKLNKVAVLLEKGVSYAN